MRSNDEQPIYDATVERARHMDVLQRAEHEFDPSPFDVEAARIYGRVTAAVLAAGRKPRRALDLMTASIAIAEGLPLYQSRRFHRTRATSDRRPRDAATDRALTAYADEAESE